MGLRELGQHDAPRAVGWGVGHASPETAQPRANTDITSAATSCGLTTSLALHSITHPRRRESTLESRFRLRTPRA